MNGSIERVRTLINGGSTDRPPLFDLLRNDAVLSHFSGETLTVKNAGRVVFAAFEPAIDATRPMVRLPRHEDATVREDGREERYFRWTVWTEPLRFASTEAWAAEKRKLLAADPGEWMVGRQREMDKYLAGIDDHRGMLGEVFFIPGGFSVGLMSLITEVGLEQFSYCLVDEAGVVDELLEYGTIRSETFISHLPDDHGIEIIFLGEDIAYNTGPMFSPAWFGNHYFHRLERIVSALHNKGIKVLFHSDGNLNALLDGLVGAGIDGLNPIEVLAGMDIGDIHRRYPGIFMAGGIDVSQLLPFGAPEQIRDAVVKAMDDAEGRIMIGSSTELNDDVPLENFLAMRQAVLDFS